MTGAPGIIPTMTSGLSRRDLLRRAALAWPLFAAPGPLLAFCRRDPDQARLAEWVGALRAGTRGTESLGAGSAAVGHLAIGTPYRPGTLDEYLKAGGDPEALEPLVLSLSHFDCVTLVESCLAVARVARAGRAPNWAAFGEEVVRMRYREGTRGDYASRLHYFSEWIADGQSRGLVRDLGAELGGVRDPRPLRFMSTHRESYPALAHEATWREIGEMERRLDDRPRWFVPTERIAGIADRVMTGDVLAFATSIEGLDVSHAAMAWRDEAGILRVLHAPLSGGVVEITRTTLPEYVAAIRRATGVMIARPEG